ncbi:hypothetical protein BCV69DRAFT_279729 [Microstroma glucosiphilum]|uniref:Uncharacterized protein n=1 Tax=Pseudomicrostroma glucosiphilum TaxID=1684307 RepID=A0A316UFY5_9BASI|nr:hypothetical protein BCV69DRAFT_279729 [Pseudomicrostroma glucosiphilum]PWN23814.1 hypothetical protein BCV69DRAFT_279729 [Pseudomicrostroma glucosiphilum]
MLRRFLATLALLAALILSATPTSAQIYPTSSEDPLSGSVFSTSSFAPSVTFTPDATYASANPAVATSIVGVGPSLSTDTYTYAYSKPTTTIQGTDLSAVYASLAANSSPTAATSDLNPNPTNLQIVPGTTNAAGVSRSQLGSATAALMVLGSLLAGVLGGMGIIFL